MKYLVIIGAIMMGLGLVIFGITLAVAGFNFELMTVTPDDYLQNGSSLFNGITVNLGGGGAYEQKAVMFENADKHLILNETLGEVKIGVSPDDAIHVTYFENNNETYEITETEDTITIDKNYSRSLFFGNFINFGPFFTQEIPHIELLLPKTFAKDIEVHSAACDVDIDDISADNVVLDVTNGIIDVDGIKANDILAEMVNGEVEISDTAVQSIKLSSTNGTVEFDELTADDIEISTVNGFIEGNILGKESDYNISSSVTLGSNTLPSNSDGDTDKTIDISTVNGGIEVDFAG